MEGIYHKGKCVAVILGEGWHGPGGGLGAVSKEGTTRHIRAQVGPSNAGGETDSGEN